MCFPRKKLLIVFIVFLIFFLCTANAFGSDEANNANLKSLSFNNGELKPDFLPDKTEYSLHVASAVYSVQVTPELDNSNASFVVKREGSEISDTAGTYAISLGENITTIEIEVTAEDNVTKKTYKIVVTRTDTQYSRCASYTTITFSSGTNRTNDLTLVLRDGQGTLLSNYADVFYYDIDIIDDANSYDEKYILGGQFGGQIINDDIIIEKVLVSDGNGSIVIPINLQENFDNGDGFTIKIYTKHPSCGDEIGQKTCRYYKLNNANLNNISFNNGELKPNFSPDNTEYSLHVASAVYSVQVTPKLEDSNASIMVKREGSEVSDTAGTYDISLGENITTIEIEVTAEDNVTKKTYKVVVTRTDCEYSCCATLVTLSDGSSVGCTINCILDLKDGQINSLANFADVFYYDINVKDDNNTFDEEYTFNGQFGGQKISDDVIIEKVLVSDGNGKIIIPIDIPQNVDYGDGFTINIYNEHPSSGDKILIGQSTYAGETYNAKLKQLSLIDSDNNDRLFGLFDPDEFDYEINLLYSVNQLKLKAVSQDSNATMKINGVERQNNEEVILDLEVGGNKVTVEVIARDGVTRRVYTITINRAEVSNNANLYGLSLLCNDLNNPIVQLDPVFNENITEYSCSVRYNIDCLQINRELGYNSTMSISGVEVDPNVKNVIYLKEGTNTVNLTMTAEDGVTKKTYTLTIHRIKWDVTDIENIVVNPGSLQPIFNKDVLEYNVNLSNDYTQIDVAATLTDSMATLKINGDKCNSGQAKTINLNEVENRISLLVTSEDGLKTKEYVVIVNRAAVLPEEKILSNIIVNNGNIDIGFSPDKTSYTIADVSRIEYQLNIHPVLASATSSRAVYINNVEVNGSDSYTVDLNEGNNKIEILVIAKGNIIANKYTINVHKDHPEYSASATHIVFDKALEEGVTSKFTICLRNQANQSITNHQDIFNFYIEVTDEDNTHNEQYKFDGEIIDESKIIRRVYTSDENGRVQFFVTVPDRVDKGDGISIKLYTKMLQDNMDPIRLLVDKESYLQNNEHSHNADLQSIVVSDGSLLPTFNRSETNYTVNVDNTVNNIKISATACEANETIKINGNSYQSGEQLDINLQVGENVVNIEVMAEDWVTKKTYIIKITRAEQQQPPGGGGGPVGGGGGGAIPPMKVHIPTKPQVLEDVKTDADKEIDANLFYNEVAKFDLSETKDKKRKVSINTMKELANKDKDLTVENKGYGIELKFTKRSLLTKETEGTKDKEATIEIGAKNLSNTERQQLLSKTPMGESTGSFAVGGKIFNLTAQVITKNEAGEENSTKIEKFNQPVAVTLDLSTLELSKEQIQQLSGVRLEKDEKGNIVPVNLGGTYDEETQTFTFYTDCFSYYTVMQFKYKMKLNMTIGKEITRLNDKEKPIDVPPMIINNRTMVPLRFIGEALGAEFNWDQKTRTVTYNLGPDKIKLVIGKKAPGLDTPPTIVNGRTLVPVRYVSERFGAKVYWDQSTQTVTVIN